MIESCSHGTVATVIFLSQLVHTDIIHNEILFIDISTTLDTIFPLIEKPNLVIYASNIMLRKGKIKTIRQLPRLVLEYQREKTKTTFRRFRSKMTSKIR